MSRRTAAIEVGAILLVNALLWGCAKPQPTTPIPSEDHIFRCRRCGYVYTDDPDVERSRCIQCGQMNEAIKF